MAKMNVVQENNFYAILRQVKKQKDKSDKVGFIAAVAIIFDDNGKILLTQRQEPSSLFHNKWQFPGGGIEYGEHPIDTVLREVKEEVGVDIKLLNTEAIVVIRTEDGHGLYGIILGFPALHVSGKLDTSGDDETAAAQWYNYDEIDFSLCLPDMKEMIEKARKHLK